MSIRLMSMVWENGPEDRGELLVMLALADFADDRGRCWPSIATIAKRARMTARSAQRILRKLEQDKLVQISIGTGRAGCNEYILTPDARVTPDTVSPLTPVSPPPDARVTPPLTPVSPEPSRTTIIGGRGSACARETNSGQGNHDLTQREELLIAMGHDRTGLTATGRLLGTEIDMAEARRWSDLGLTFDQQINIIREVMATKRDGPPTSFRFFRQPMQRAAAAFAEGPLQPISAQARGHPSRPTIDVAAIIATIPDPE